MARDEGAGDAIEEVEENRLRISSLALNQD